MADAGSVSAATVSLGQTVMSYSFFLPKLSEVRRADPADSGMRGDVVLGQIAAGSLSLATGLLLSWMTGSRLPTLASVFIIIVIASMYHYALVGGQQVGE